MDSDLMNELDDLLAAADAPQPAMAPPPTTVPKGAKDVLGERLAEKRKLVEAGGPPELLSKTQKMDNGTDLEADFNAVVNGGGGDDHVNVGSQRLLAQALMEKRPPPQQQQQQQQPQGPQQTMIGLRSPPPSENAMLSSLLNKFQELQREKRHDEIKSLLQGPHGPKLREVLAANSHKKMMNPNMNNGPMMTSDGNGTMIDPNYYNQPQRPPMQPQMQRPPMGSPMGQSPWPNGPQQTMGGYNGQPQRTMRPPQGGRYFNDGGPPPNAWVQPNLNPGGPGNPGGPQNPAYYRNNLCQQPRPPMMRPTGMNNHYGDFPNGNPATAGGQMYGQMRNYNMAPNGDPYGNTRFGSPNGVCSPMYSPNGTPDSMMRMNGNFVNDSVNSVNSAATNPGNYNNFNDFGYNNRVRPNFIQNGGPQQQPPPQPQQPQMMPSFNGRPLNQSSPMYQHGTNMQQTQQTNQGFNNYNINNMDQHHQQQQHPQHPQQQQPPPQPNSMINGPGGPGGPGVPGGPGGPGPGPDFDFPNGMIENNNELMEWKSQASEVRKALLAKLTEALLGVHQPDAMTRAKEIECMAFNNANNLNDYKLSLARELASVYDYSPASIPVVSPPDSSTNDQISDVTTSSNPNEVGGSNGNNEAVNNKALEELLTSRSVSPTTVASPNGVTSIASSPVSSVASSIAITSSSPPSTLSTLTTTTTSSPLTSGTSTTTSNSTFQCPAMPPASSQHSDATNEKSLNGGPASNRPPVGSNQPPQQRRISGSGALSTAVAASVAAAATSLPVSSISNNPQSVDSGIGLGSPRSITSASSSTLYSPKIQGTSPSLLPGSDNSPEKASSS